MNESQHASSTARPLRVARVATIPLAFWVYRDFYSYLMQHGCDITFVCAGEDGGGDDGARLRQWGAARHVEVDIPRQISLLKDLMAVWKLYRIFRRERFDIVHSYTPKAGLVTAIAGLLARVPVRMHTFTGQRWATLSGLKRRLLMACDRIIASLNTVCYADSPSQARFLVESNVAKPDQVSCLHHGSFAGVNLRRFDKGAIADTREHVCRAAGCDPDALIITFVGRVVRDKGIEELLRAFSLLYEENNRLALLLIGPYEPDLDPLPRHCHQTIREHPGVFALGKQTNPEYYLSATDVFCLPSYREGFGTVILEAAGMKVPAVGTDIVGLRDAIAHGETGLLVEPRNAEALRDALRTLANDGPWRQAMGQRAYDRVRRHFEMTVVARKNLEEYARLCQRRPNPARRQAA